MAPHRVDAAHMLFHLKGSLSAVSDAPSRRCPHCVRGGLWGGCLTTKISSFSARGSRDPLVVCRVHPKVFFFFFKKHLLKYIIILSNILCVYFACKMRGNYWKTPECTLMLRICDRKESNAFATLHQNRVTEITKPL